MNEHLKQKIEQKTGRTIVSEAAFGGGSSASVLRIEFSDRSAALLKYGKTSSDVFEKEANGLKELSRSKTIYIPEVLAVGSDFLLTEYLKSASMKTNAMYEFGVNFAKMHRFTNEYLGFYEDNYLGDAPQKNGANRKSKDWRSFFWEFRLKFQIEWAINKQILPQRLIEKFDLFEPVYHKLLENTDNTPRLLHGDLWSGNYVVNQTGAISIIDPAVYYGHREADLAMTKLFGGFGADFYQGYNDEFPLETNWQQREDIYKLYHILNHYNLFGGGYLLQAEHILDNYIN